MTGEIDPLILQLRADVDRFIRDVRRAQSDSDRRMQQMEQRFRASGASISASLKGISASLATAFSGTQVVGMIDSYTRLQNALKVTGLEGERLAEVQQRLFAVAQQNGVELEAVGQLYSRAAQNQKELGASTSDLINLTSAVAASLRISGTSTQEASGALLQLGQALGSPRIQAEEFNSLLDTMQPLLRQAAKNIEGTGGTLAGLTQRIKDTNGPGVTNVELFRAITAALADLEKQAANSQVTLAGAFTKLSNALTTYVGEAASSSGATDALASGIERLAENIDDLAQIAAIVAVALGTRFAAGAAVAATQAVGLRVVALGLAASLNGTAAAATLAGRALLTAMTGPVGIAIGAIAIGLAVVAANTEGAEAATGQYKAALDTARASSDAAKEAADRLASATGKAREEALKSAQAQREVAKQNLATAKSSLIAARAELEKAKAFRAAQNRASFAAGGVPGTAGFIQGTGETRVATARANEAAALEAVRTNEESIRVLETQINSSAPPVVSAPTSRTSASRSTSSAPSGPSAAEVEARFLDELASIRSRILSADAQRATSAEERAAFERKQLELVEASELRRLAADEDLTEAQKAQLFLRLSELANAEREAIAFRERAEIEQRNAELADERGRAQLDALRLQFDLATTDKDRRRIALDILKAEQAILREKLQAQINSGTLNDADKKLARIKLAALDAQAADQEESVKRQFASPLQRFAIDAEDSDKRVEEAAVRRIEQLNQTITDAMTNALGIKDPFLSQLISIFLDRNVFGPLAEALGGAGGGGGGGLGAAIGSLFGSLFGRSSGGRVNAGSIYRVNEGASPGRVEAFRPDVSGQIIPLGRMNAVRDGGAQGGGGVATVRLELSGDIDARIERVSGPVAIEVVRQTAPQVIDAAANETLSRASRPRL